MYYFLWNDISESESQSCPTLCDPIDCSTPGFPVLLHLPEFTQTHQLVMPSNHLILCHPLLLPPSIFPSVSEVKVAQFHPTLWPHGLYSPWNSPGQNTGVGSLSLLLGIFPTQGSNPGLSHCRQILYQLSHQGSPKNTYIPPCQSHPSRSSQSTELRSLCCVAAPL